jgi:hypothetical protein
MQFHGAAGMRQVRMTELDRNGRQQVEERGGLPGIELGVAWLHPAWIFDVSGEMYSAHISYAGQTQTGSRFDTDTGTKQSRLSLQASRRLSNTADLVAAVEWDYWRRDIASRGATLGLEERNLSLRLLAGTQVRMLQSRFADLTLKGLLILSSPENLKVRFGQNVFDQAALRTAQGIGGHLSIVLQRLAGSRLDIQTDYERLRIPRSSDVVLHRDGAAVGLLAQPKHLRSSLGAKIIYRF